MILILSDTHGENDSFKLNNKYVKKLCDDVFPNYVIITGDFGFIWSVKSDDTEKYWLKWLDSKPWITLFIDGNHENFERLNMLPIENKFGSKVGKVSDKVFHLKRGEIYTIEDKTFFTFGGARSIDIENRIDHFSWWKEEEPNYVEYLHGIESLERVNYNTDYVLSHTCPISIFEKIKNLLPSWKLEKGNDSTCLLLEAYKEKLQFKNWLFGHFHIDVNIDDRKYVTLYNKGFLIQ